MICIYIILENANRELNSRILLILQLFKVLKNKRINVIIGEKNELRNKIINYPKGIIIEKGVTKGSISRVKKWKKAGHDIFMFDEESITYRDDKQYFATKFDKDLEKYTDCFFLTGERQKKTILRKRKNTKYLLTGNLRFELLKLEYRKFYEKIVDIYKKKHGDFILITSRFANLNYNDTKKVKQPSSKYGDYLKDSKIIFQEFKKIPYEFREKCNNKIIIRPHPSEDVTTWNKITKKIDNCEIIYEGDIVPWLLASKLVIFNRCTTGIEGYLLNKKTFSLDPIVEKDPLKKLYRSISKNFKTAKNLVNEIAENKRFLLNYKNLANDDLLRQYIFNTKKKESHKIIANFIKKRINKIKINKNKKFSLVTPVDLLKLFLGNLLSIKKGSRKYMKQKIGKFNYFSIKKSINEFKQIDVFNNVKDLKIKQIGKRIFLLSNLG
tara:strand:+ start:4759 stop:6075 length:1317 start_codon:yes stop_codon:yes gene_type:complete